MGNGEETGQEDEVSGAAGLEGYLYQVDVSIWVALDFVVAKQLATHVVLEPVGQEDLEAPFEETELGAVRTQTPLAGRQLVVQAKLRNTGSWTLRSLGDLLLHGTRRESAAARLERDRDAAFLIITSADLHGEARKLRIPSLNAQGWPTALPATIRKLAPSADGRLAVLGAEDPWKLERKLWELLEEGFRVPRARRQTCLDALRAAALERMRGVAGGRWTRDEIVAVLQAHDGRLVRSAERESFVAPTNWGELRSALQTNHGVVIAGTSGTGKTTAARVLAEEMEDRTSGLSIVTIDQGPEQVRADRTAEPVLYLIDDPWGHYRFEPQARPWNDELGRLLAGASANRMFVVTSRSDVLHDSGARPLDRKWYVQLEAENYGPAQRNRLFENRLPRLAPELQLLAERYRRDVLTELLSPLEIQKFFDDLGEGNRTGDPDHVFLHACVRAAHENAIEDTVVQQVEARGAGAAAAILWGVLKARPKQSRDMLQRIEAGLARADRALEDVLEPLINAFVAARHLRREERWISYYHPRIEKALEAAIRKSPQRTRRILETLADVLVGLDGASADDWGRESGALLLRSVANTPELDAEASAEAQVRLDAWLEASLAGGTADFGRLLSLAAVVGRSPISEVARWLLHKQGDFSNFMPGWSPKPEDSAWYAARAAEPLTAAVCAKFVREVLPRDRDSYPDDFRDHLDKLSRDLDAAFLDAARAIVGYGVFFNSDPIALGALRDLDGFAAIADQAITVQDSVHVDPTLWLAVRNGEYSDDYAQHLAESAAEDGYTADELLAAYVKALRERRGWSAVEVEARSKPMLLRYWMQQARQDKDHPPPPEEIRAITDQALDGPFEAKGWWLCRDHWTPLLTRDLMRRVETGAADEDTRLAAAACAAQHASDELAALAARLEETNLDRLAELIVDLSNDFPARRGEDGPDKVIIASILAKLAPQSAAALGLLAEREPTADGPALAWLGTRDPKGNVSLQLRLAEVLGASGVDVADRANRLLDADSGDHDVDDAAALWAVKWAATSRDTALLRRALYNRYADVRSAALEALAGLTDGPLPPDLLALFEDASGRVRRKLLDLLDARRSPEHLPTLLRMACDDWNESSGFYGETPSFPISRRAADILATTPDLPDDAVDTLAAQAPLMEDESARDRLLKVLAHSGAYGHRLLVTMALDRQRVPLGAAATWALIMSDTPVDPALLIDIDAPELLIRRALVAARMAVLVGLRGRLDQAVAVAMELSGHPRRRALLLALIVGAASRSDGTCEAIVALAPDGLGQATVAAYRNQGPKLRPDQLPEGDPRIGEALLTLLASVFEPKPK